MTRAEYNELRYIKNSLKNRTLASYTYFIMDDSFRNDRDDYILGKQGVNILKERTCNEAERSYIEQNAECFEKFEWAYNMVYLMKQACGHYELFQTHVNSEKEALEWLELMAKESENLKCTRCICGW